MQPNPTFPPEVAGLWVLEYSRQSKQVHIHSIEKMLETNVRGILLQQGASDFVPIGIFKTGQEASQAADEFEKVLARQSQSEG